MRITRNTLLGMLLLLTCCNSPTPHDRTNYVESQPSFFGLRNGGWLTNEWIRKPENLLRVHETFKKFGYSNIISRHLLFDSPLIIQDIYIYKKGSQLLDSLAITFHNKYIKEKYYREFWERRKAENNDSIVYLIINEINYSIKHKEKLTDLSVTDSLVNDTLLNLLAIEFRTDSLTAQLATADVEALKQFGFHQSAYNLLFEKYKYRNIKWNRDSLAQTLTPANTGIFPWFQDDTP